MLCSILARTPVEADSNNRIERKKKPTTRSTMDATVLSPPRWPGLMCPGRKKQIVWSAGRGRKVLGFGNVFERLKLYVGSMAVKSRPAIVSIPISRHNL
jgi:hypothetical protein